MIEKRHVGEQVLSILRKKILLNELKEGEHLKEKELSMQLNISRGPIREAITKLETEGLVNTRSNGRTIVNKFDSNDIKNLYDSRILLESYALSQLNQTTIKKNSSLLHSINRDLKKSYENGYNDVESDLDFHALLITMTNNKTLIQLWQSLKGLVRTLIEVTSSFEDLNQEKIISEHTMIVSALENGEIEKAQKILEDHLDGVRNHIFEQLNNNLDKNSQDHLIG